jgi:MazG family protein
LGFPHLQRLLDILDRLRGPAGCPWDRAQTLATAARYLADEVHEYADVAVAADLTEARKELADLLYMVCFNWQLLNEQSPVAFDDLAHAGAEKLVRRHPHVFGDAQARTEQDSQLLWNRIKAQERAAAAGGDTAAAGGASAPAPASALKKLAPSVSPLRQAALYGSSAADVGFDWPDAAGALRKLEEELHELRHALGEGDATAASAELGDVLFAAVQSARKLGVDPDAALREANRRFARRFHQLESAFGHDAQRLRAASPAELLDAWRDTRERGAETPPAHPSSGQPSSSDTPS